MAYRGWTDGDDLAWDDVSTDAPTPLEPGIYRVKVTKAEAKKTQTSNQPSVALEFEASERHGSDEELKRRLFDNFTFAKDALFKPKQFAESVGDDLELPASSRYKDVVQFAEDLLGVEVWAVVSVRKYQGRERNQVDRYVHDDEVDEAAEKLAGEDADSDEPQPRRTREKPGRKGSKAARETQRASNGAKDREEIDDRVDDEQQEEQPRRARGRRRAAEAE